MPWYLRPGFWLFLLLLSASVFSAFMHLRAQRRERRQIDRDLVLHRVDALLCVWVETWGDPPEAQKAKLQDVLAKYPRR